MKGSDEAVSAALRQLVGEMEHGERRASQEEMAHAVDHALASGRHLVVRAGTGTGKSLAYLLPAVLRGKKVVVSTSTKALQDQLVTNDVPLVGRALGREVSVGVVKGRANYLCRQRLQEATGRGHQVELTEALDLSPKSRDGDLVRRIFAWSETTTTGERGELEEEPSGSVWSAFSVGPDECPGAANCPSGTDCFSEAARRRAEDADVVVVNHHLLGANLRYVSGIIPEADLLVIDEAHDFEEAMSESLGFRLSAGRLRALAATVRRVLGAKGEIADELTELSTRFDETFRPLVATRLSLPFDDALAALFSLGLSRLERAESRLHAPGEGPRRDDQRLLRARTTCARMREELERLVELGENDVAFVSGTERPVLEVAPIDVAPLLKETVFTERPVVLTSATVPLDLGAHLGVADKDHDRRDVGSPFDYASQTLLYCAAHLPDRRSSSSEQAVIDELAVLIEAAGGRTLALFTATEVMSRVAKALRDKVPFPIITQGEQSKGAALASFSENEEACLFATMGFWQGVDVPGSTLSLVVIDRLPFARPDDPLFSARRERAGREAFLRVDLPRAAMLLAQGAGRLVRRSSDRGVVAVLDPRLASASYRWDLVRALPPMRRTKEQKEVLAFLRALR